MAPRGKSKNGSGHGRGRGRGPGHGRSGHGKGRGVNRGMRQGAGQGTEFRTDSSPANLTQPMQHTECVHPSPSVSTSSAKEIEKLMAQADTMMAQLQDVNAHISVLQSGNTLEPSGVAAVHERRRTVNGRDGGRTTAVVDQEECIKCGICADVCPEEAITMMDITVIDNQKCTGCGACVEACPDQAITLGVLTRMV